MSIPFWHHHRHHVQNFKTAALLLNFLSYDVLTFAFFKEDCNILTIQKIKFLLRNFRFQKTLK